MTRFLFLSLLLFFVSALEAQGIWTDVTGRPVPEVGERRIEPAKYRVYRLDLQAMQALLAAAPERFTPAAAGALPVLTLPSPDGGTARFHLTESPVMAPDLQTRYDAIRCYTGVGIDDPSATLKCDLTPHGFHAMVFSNRTGVWFIDPYSHGDVEHYSVYFKKDYRTDKDEAPFACETESEFEEIKPFEAAAAEFQGDCKLRRYRLALACTGEYGVYHGGTKSLVLAAMNTAMNRVNGVYERESAITMQLVPNNDTLIFLSGATDPYTNNNTGTMLDQNQSTCDARIGTANYDIGHVFGTGNGGIANLSSVCSSANKARGVTGRSQPVGDAFTIDYVAHEMGHQFGAQHTQNNDCNRVASSSMEPGSASTIMGYAGICSPNVQSNSDDYFHAISLQQIGNFITNGNGNVCPVKITTGNNAPTVSAGADYTIPRSTPFVLTAQGSDVDGDTLTYCWEQMDPQFATMPPVSSNVGGPLFRSFDPTPSPQRFFPRLPDLINNINSQWEELPGVSRLMNFRVTVRDNNSGAGCTEEDDALITVAGNAGPFTVTAPNTNVTWEVGSLQTVTWNVAGTDQAPVNCGLVRISLSTNGGFAYPIVLADSVPNTGSFVVTVPNAVSNACRIQVASVGNIFFDISNQNFRIQQPVVPSFSLTAANDSLSACANESGTLQLLTAPLNGFNAPIAFTVSGGPAGAAISVNPDTIAPGGSANLLVENLTPDMAGTYLLTLQASGGPVTQTLSITLEVLPGSPDAPAQASPADGASGLPLNPTLAWNAVPLAARYAVEVATNPAFDAGSIVFAAQAAGTALPASSLQAATVYYWRLRALNDCAPGPYSPVWAFQTGNPECDQLFVATDVPKPIDGATINTVTSVLPVTAVKPVLDLSVSLQIDHAYVGDLDARLVSPDGDTVLLFDRPGVPADNFGCEGDDLDLVFDDEAIQSAADLENSCNDIPPAIQGAFRPVQPLSIVKGGPAQGSWTLLVGDNYDDDGGALTAWRLNFCLADPIPPGALLANNPLEVGAGGSATISAAQLQLQLADSASQGVFTLLSLPQHGALSLDGIPLSVGGTFAQTDIDAGLLAYAHNGNGSTTDTFLFDALDTGNNAWVHGAVFNIVIVQNTLTASAAVSQPVSCHNGADGAITVAPSGLAGPYAYSLDGGPFQSGNVFDSLPPGSYTVVVRGAFGFTATANQVLIDNPTPVTAGAAVSDDDLTASAAGGAGNYTYSIDGVNFQSNPLFENLPNGIYTITAQDSNGCTDTTTAIVAVNTLIATLALQQAVSCFGGADGAIAVTLGGGQPPYEYSVNGGLFQPDTVLQGLSAGTYTVEIKDNQGFTAVTNAVVVPEPPAIVAATSVVLNVITVSASGGAGNFTYSLDGQSFQNDSIFGNLQNGTYNVVVRDASGCTVTVPAVVDVPPLTITELSVTQPLCASDTIVYATITATGGIEPYQYRVNGGAWQDTNVVQIILPANPIVIEVQDALGAVVSSSSLIIVTPPALLPSASVHGNDVSFAVTGGTPPYGLFLNGVPIDETELEDLPNGGYTLVALDANGCFATTTFEINYVPVMLDLAFITEPTCQGTANGSIGAQATGGLPPYLYQLDGSAPQDNGNFGNLAAGTYTIYVTDDEGTVDSLVFTLDYPVLVISAEVDGDTITVSADGGTAPYLYSIDGGLTFQASPVFTGVPNGTYTVVAVDANDCPISTEVMVSGTVDPRAAWGLQVNPNPGAGLFNIQWQTGASSLRAAVYDLTGRLIQEAEWTGNRAELDLGAMPAGMYILHLHDGVRTGGVRLSVVR